MTACVVSLVVFICRTGQGPVEAVEYQVHWACGGKRAVEAYFNDENVRAAIHVTPTRLKQWTTETDLNYTCSVSIYYWRILNVDFENEV